MAGALQHQQAQQHANDGQLPPEHEKQDPITRLQSGKTVPPPSQSPQFLSREANAVA